MALYCKLPMARYKAYRMGDNDGLYPNWLCEFIVYNLTIRFANNKLYTPIVLPNGSRDWQEIENGQYIVLNINNGQYSILTEKAFKKQYGKIKKKRGKSNGNKILH